jgi:hypothetical protein
MDSGACAAIRRAIGEAPHDLDRIDQPATRAPAKRSRVHPAERHDGLPFGLTILRPDANLFVPYAIRRAIIASPHDLVFCRHKKTPPKRGFL